MTALLRKDLYVADKQMRLVVVLALVFCLIPGFSTFGITYAMVLAFLLPISTITYDEKCRWDRYAAMLPYRPGQIVGSKYLLSLLGAAFAALVILLRQLAQSWRDGGAGDVGETVTMMVLLLLMVLVMTDLGIPLSYRFGAEKGRIVQIGLLIMVGALFGGAFGLLGEVGAEALLRSLLRSLFALPWPLLGGVAAALAALLTFLSYRISVRCYVKRRNGCYD